MVVIRAFLPLVFIIILFVSLTQIGFAKISEIRSKITTAKHDKAVLTEKLDLLRTVASTGVQDSNVVTNALPDSAPALAVMSQLKKLAAESNLVLKALKSSGGATETEADFYTMQLSFNLLGSKSDIAGFVGQLPSLAPITSLESVKISQAGAGFISTVTIKSFWAPFPEKLPSSIEEFKDLTPEDKTLLSELSNLKQPSYISLPPPNLEGTDDPFAK